MKKDVVIIGAGASGLMCALEAGTRGRSVLVLEHADKICNKVRISGGGRCNFTNRDVSSRNYISRNPHFATSALSRFTAGDFISMMEKQGVEFCEEEAGRLFCRRSSGDLVHMLKKECDGASAQFALSSKIHEVRKDRRFSIATGNGPIQSDSLVIATGGLAAPGLGASNFGYAIAKQFQMKVTALKPALTPLRFGPEETKAFGSLSGISLDSIVSFGGVKFRDKLLFTHKGLSGPAILQISSYWDESSSISIDLLPEIDIARIFGENHRSKMLLSNLLDRYLPGRLVKYWCSLYSHPKPLNSYSAKDLDSIASALHNWQVQPCGKEGFNKAEVTSGGVDTDELSSKTMESKKVPGLYFIGEVVDVTGQLGGYNLHWAWASGYAAGQFV